MSPQLRICKRSVRRPWRAVFGAMCACTLAGLGEAQAQTQWQQTHKLTEGYFEFNALGELMGLLGDHH